MSIADIATAVAALRAGKPVIVADDEDRENEGDVILSAQLATPEWVAWTVKHSSGLLCAPMPDSVADRLDLPMMVERNEDVRSTAYTVTVDAASGVTTGISAKDRTATLRILADPDSVPADLNRPGHILPLRAVAGGVRERPGHTEAAVELMRLAGLSPVAVIAEIVADDGDMMRLPELQELGRREDVPVTTIAKLITYLEEHEPLVCSAADCSAAPSNRVQQLADTVIPTVYGDLRTIAFRDRHTGVEHLALMAPDTVLHQNSLVRLHSECLTGEALGSLKCECGPQLATALAEVVAHGGVVLYLRGQEGRGIGLANKLRAYELQAQGRDTVDANLELGLPVDARDYTAAAEILKTLGLTTVRLLTNNTDKRDQLASRGITVTELVPLIVSIGAENLSYMQTKRDRMRHLLPDELG